MVLVPAPSPDKKGELELGADNTTVKE